MLQRVVFKLNILVCLTKSLHYLLWRIVDGLSITSMTDLVTKEGKTFPWALLYWLVLFWMSFKKFIWFLVALGLCFCTRAFSIIVASGVPPHCSARVSLGVVSLAAERRGWGAWVSVVVVHGHSCSKTCRIFPRLGIEPVSPALTGRFLSPVLPEKSLNV